MSAMQHSGGVFLTMQWNHASWPPPSSFPATESYSLQNATVTHVQNLQFKKAGSQSKYLSGKRTEDTIYKCIGISVKLGGVGSGFSSGIESYFEEYVGRSIEEKTEHATEGDGLHFTFYGPPTMISALRSEGSVGDDPVRAGDVVNLDTRGASLFLNTISIVRAERDNAMASLHQVTNLYHAPAVNVDDGLAENIKKAQALIKEPEKVVEEDPDVEDDEWDD
eukprot:CAMPEP_0182465148 /NCGR_PEP_ID=MMETSP1319-20130603/9027_1 /TAXON_ID=172717 /ORGANISM="Bolidomonas pacifica, Strain RCC208" /LENGTH=221 /DNA_ID=CAMNT_0024664839 /DNA_START=14 /DNA_END=679 /DNA_ORIENTATION=+